MPLSRAEEEDLKHRVDREARALADEFNGVLAKETVDRVVAESLEAFRDSSKVAWFIPTLVRRFARERLKALAQAEQLVGKDRPEVLFVCAHNAGRSQMAAALATARSEGRVHARSAGLDPSGNVDPAVAEAMNELGLDLSEEFPKPLTDDVVRAADFVVTLGCRDSCPVYPGVRYVDWPLDDPAGQPIEVVRDIRDQIDDRVRWLLAEMGIGLYR